MTGLDWQDLFTAVALVLVIEGLLPFINPGAWRRMLTQISQMPDSTLRTVALGVMIVGLLLLGLVR